MRGDFGGTFLGEAKCEIREGPLKGPERWPMNRVNNDGNSSASGRKPAQDSGFATVGVNDVGLQNTEEFGQVPERSPVLPRMHWPNHFRDEPQQIGAICE